MRRQRGGRTVWIAWSLTAVAVLTSAGVGAAPRVEPASLSPDRLVGTVAPGSTVRPPASGAGVPAAPREPRSHGVVASDVRAVHLPVVLVPGWNDDAEDLAPLQGRLEEAGWSPGRVHRLTFEDPVGSNRDHAREIAAAVDSIVHRSGSDRVDVVAHSMGGLAVRRYLLDGGADRVRKVVFLASPQNGTAAAYLAWGEGAEEMRPGSAFLLGLRRALALPEGVHGITIRTPLDLHILPAESAMLPGIPNLEVCCPTHAGLLDHDETFDLIERFLESP